MGDNRKSKVRKKKKKRGFFRTLFRIIWVMIKAVVLLCFLAVIVATAYLSYTYLPILKGYNDDVKTVVENSNLDTFRLQEASFIYDAAGDVIAKLQGDEDSSYIEFENIPEDAVNAFVAIEDRTFWENPGIDVKGIARVGINFLKSSGDEMHGASTITQQLARNRFLTREVSIERKIKEMIISLNLTKKYSKKQIMEFYINDISFANMYYGLQSAARGYFSKDANELSLSQIAYLCAIPNSPTYYNPYHHPENAIVRRDKILNDMCELGFITEKERDKALKEKIVLNRHRVEMRNYETTYAIDCAVRYLMRKDGFEFKYGFRSYDEHSEYQKHYNEVYNQEKDALYTGGYNLYTSIDPKMQAIVQDSIDSVLSFDDKMSESGIYMFQGASTVVDNSTGKVIAIVGGRSQETTTYTLNRAYQSARQPGSTIKPLVVYTPALENGFKSTTMVRNISVDAGKEKDVVIGELAGDAMPLRNAVWASKNGVAWYIYDNLTPELGMAYLTQMRFASIVPDDYYQAGCLGGFTNGVTTEEMAGAYEALVNNGVYQEPTCIVKMINNKGEDIFEEYPTYPVYQENSAAEMVDILTGVVTSGTAAKMGWRSKIQAAGKTGTTNGSKDGWFCGMTPYYTMSVWVGYDQPKKLSNLYGGTYPASIWKKAMEQMTEGYAECKFDGIWSDTGMGDGSTYLQGKSYDDMISRDYSVDDFRDDHNKADSAWRLVLESRGNMKEATELVETIKYDSMKRRMLHILKTGNPVFAPVAEVVPETLPVESESVTVEGAPTGPGSDKSLGNNSNQAVGPGAVQNVTQPAPAPLPPLPEPPAPAPAPAPGPGVEPPAP